MLAYIFVCVGGIMPIHLIIKYGVHMRANPVVYWSHLNLCSEPVLSFAMLRQHLNCGGSNNMNHLNNCRDPGSA